MLDCLPCTVHLNSCSRLSNVSSIGIPHLKRNLLKIKPIRNASLSSSDKHEFKYRKLGFKEEKGRSDVELKKRRQGSDEEVEKMETSAVRNGTSKEAEESSTDEFLGFRSGMNSLAKDEGLVSGKGVDDKLEELERQQDEPVSVVRSAKQMLRRSNVMAKQVISISSALSLGFISQLWVDTNSWVILVVEVRPNLLSGEFERFRLEDITQVGDVVLVEDENVMDNEFKLVGLESLVGYTVVTPGQRSIGKVRGYTFNINTGAVESLELDSFGISIIPSSLVSTYALLVGDVQEVLPDTVVVYEATAARIQRLTKGFWDGQSVGNPFVDYEEYTDRGRRDQGDVGKGDRGDVYRRKDRGSSSRKFRSKRRETTDDWELPMDYL